LNVVCPSRACLVTRKHRPRRSRLCTRPGNVEERSGTPRNELCLGFRSLLSKAATRLVFSESRIKVDSRRRFRRPPAGLADRCAILAVCEPSKRSSGGHSDAGMKIKLDENPLRNAAHPAASPGRAALRARVRSCSRVSRCVVALLRRSDRFQDSNPSARTELTDAVPEL
jgi:hypothetical protein